ncbi:hypothetical protein OSB04_006697 [Centaurea solstitialis]|uniref:Reverse transcriptase domain-containing protein n=1 Tax=Centaurea solstitialis TaxID=347529 RepID=A0AA38U1N2_9ASTR|nr:hypothetical protein OSB04_006697 [Centaurea solstitialis]
MDSGDEIRYESDWDNIKRLEREKADLTMQVAKAVAQVKEKDLHMNNQIKEQELQMKNQIKRKKLQMKYQIKEKELEFAKQIEETKLQCKKQIKESSKIIQMLDEKLHMIGQSERTIFLNQPNALRDFYDVKWGLGYENPNLLQQAIEEKPAFYNLTDLRMCARFPILKGFTMEEEFSEMQEMKKNDPMFQEAKYHRVKFVYSSDNLRIKSKDSTNSSDPPVYPDIDSSQESNKAKHDLDVLQLACDIDPTNLSLRDDLLSSRLSYIQARNDEEVAAMQRAKVKWLSEGDSNTRFFHKVIKEKRHSQQIHSIKNMSGDYVYDEEVPKAFLDYLKSIIGTTDMSTDPHVPEGLIVNKLSIENAMFMIRPFTDKDVHDAMFSIGNEKAPGPDGFSAKFFKVAWNVIGNDVSIAIHNFFYRSHLAGELNHTLLCLLPKSNNATSVSDFRPIACCTVMYKCISKMLVDRIKPVLDGLVSRTQSAFIPGRRIVDNILMAHELVVGYHLNVGQPRCAFKIDIRKAYDMVNWEFLLNMLAGFGFHPALIRWIKELISSPSFSISLNGEVSGFFRGARGIRQGDPLSPYLFTLVMEGFSLLFKRCISEARNFGYHAGCADLEITHLCFADDLFVFTYGDVASVEVLKRALHLFATHSGLSANLQKSEVFFGNVPQVTQCAILECLPFTMGTFPIRYLGVPLSPIHLKVADYGVLVSKVKNRIGNWKTKFLSFGGRKQLVISVLQSLQLYWMAIFLFPSAVVHDLEAAFRDFLWAHGNSSKGKCKIAWNQVCRPMINGGLGFKRLVTWNRALLVKQLWDIVTKRDSVWVSWVYRYYLNAGSVWRANPLGKWSWTFRKVMALREEVRRFFKVRIGNGECTNAWEDIWVLPVHIASIVSYRTIHSSGFHVNDTVSDFVSSLNGHWPTDWTSRFPCFHSVSVPSLIPNKHDLIYWDEDMSGKFSVRKAYISLDGAHPVVPWHASVWFKGHIPKHSFCLWVACLNRLPTQDRIHTWKQDPPDMVCSLCGTGPDSHNHLFFECSFSKQVWRKARSAVHWMDFPDDWGGIMDAISGTNSAPKFLVHKLTLAASVYLVWRERNNRLFAAKKKPPDVVAKEINDVVKLQEKILELENLLKTTQSENASLIIKEKTKSIDERDKLLEQIKFLQQVVNESEHELVNERNRFAKDREEYVKEILELQRTVADLQKVSEDKGGHEKQNVELEFAKERHMFETEIEKITKTAYDLQNTLTEERKVFDLKSVNLSKKIYELERKIILDKKNSLKKPSLRVGKYQNMMHDFEEEIQVVQSKRKFDEKKSIELQKQIVDLQNQLSDERSLFKRKEKVLQSEKSVLEQIIAEPKKKSVEEKDFEDQREVFENEIKKLTSRLSGLSTDILNEQRMRSDQQQKLVDLVEERNKLSAKVKELEEIVFKVNLTEQRSPDVILQSSYHDDTNSVCSFKTAHDSFHVDVAPRRNINSSGQIRSSNLFYDRRVDRSGNHHSPKDWWLLNIQFRTRISFMRFNDIEVSMINPEPEDLPKKHNPRLDLVCEGVNEDSPNHHEGEKLYQRHMRRHGEDMCCSVKDSVEYFKIIVDLKSSR